MSLNPDRILKTGVAEYVEAAFDGENRSGFDPINDKVLIMVDQVRDKTSGGIDLPAETVERMQLSAETGVIVAMGQGAFFWAADRQSRWAGRRPCVGDQVYMERYSGQILYGVDGVKYRLMDDKCIGAVRPTIASTDSEISILLSRPQAA